MIWGALALSALLALLGWFYLEPGRPPIESRSAETLDGRRLALPSGSTHLVEAGPIDGRSVVLIHGFGIPAYNWAPTAAALGAAGFRACAYDLYGRGDSARPWRRYDLALYVEQLDALIETLALSEPVLLVGHSMGGLIAAAYAARYPRRVAGISLIAPLVEPPRWRGLWPLLIPGVGEAHFGLRYLPSMRRRQTSPERLRRFSLQMQHRGFRRAMLSTVRWIASWPAAEVWSALASHELPVQMLWSRDDDDLPFASGERLAAQLPGCRFEALDALGHSPHVAAPQRIAPRIIEALEAFGER